MSGFGLLNEANHYHATQPRFAKPGPGDEKWRRQHERKGQKGKCRGKPVANTNTTQGEANSQKRQIKGKWKSKWQEKVLPGPIKGGEKREEDEIQGKSNSKSLGGKKVKQYRAGGGPGLPLERTDKGGKGREQVRNERIRRVGTS